jgi:hypothetical protein
MKKFKEVVRRILCLPLYFGALIALIVHLLWGEKSFWVDGVFVTELKKDSWPMRTWYKGWGGTCFGYGVMLAFDQSSNVLLHELIHTEQNEAGCIAGFLLGIVCSIFTLNLFPFFLCWFFSEKLAYIGASIISFLRGEPNAYRGNHMEEAARAVSGEVCREQS